MYDVGRDNQTQSRVQSQLIFFYPDVRVRVRGRTSEPHLPSIDGNMELPGKLSEYVSWFERELDSVVQFWLVHSHDKKHGYV